MNDRTIEINFHFFDLNLTSYNDRGAKNSSSLLKEVFSFTHK